MIHNGIRVLHEHDDLGEDSFHEWWVPGGKVLRSRSGATNANTWGWFVVRCSNFDCGAEAIIRADVLTAAVTALLPAAVAPAGSGEPA